MKINCKETSFLPNSNITKNKITEIAENYLYEAKPLHIMHYAYLNKVTRTSFTVVRPSFTPYPLKLENYAVFR